MRFRASQGLNPVSAPCRLVILAKLPLCAPRFLICPMGDDLSVQWGHCRDFTDKCSKCSLLSSPPLLREKSS